jgi:excisionase family DNA binding protein
MESLNLMNAQEAADYLGVELHWLQTRWKSQGIPTIRFTPRGHLHFRKSALDEWVASREIVGDQSGTSERRKSKSRKVALV